MVDIIAAGKKGLNAAKVPLLGVALPLVVGTVVVTAVRAVIKK